MNSPDKATVEIDGEVFPKVYDTLAAIQFRDYQRLPESLRRRYIQDNVEPTMKALAAEKEKAVELQATLDLIQTAYERGTKAWQEATGKTMATPDTGDLVQFLLEKVEGLEERVDRLLEDRRDILTVDTTDGLTASEWVLRTGHANTRAEQAETKVARLVDEMKEIKSRVDRHEPGASILADTVRGICELAIEEVTNG